jgi:hypothetical protein
MQGKEEYCEIFVIVLLVGPQSVDFLRVWQRKKSVVTGRKSRMHYIFKVQETLLRGFKFWKVQGSVSDSILLFSDSFQEKATECPLNI